MRSQEIGWSNEEKLLYEIYKELNLTIKAVLGTTTTTTTTTLP